MDEINTYLDSSQCVVFGGYLRFVLSGLYASILFPCCAALCPRLFICSLHTNGTSCTSTSSWSGPFASTMVGARYPLFATRTPAGHCHVRSTLSCPVCTHPRRRSLCGSLVWTTLFRCRIRRVHHIVSAKCYNINIVVIIDNFTYLSHSRRPAAGTC